MWEDRVQERITIIDDFGKRKLPWAIDVLLYPMSPTAIGNLVVFVGLPILMSKFVLINRFIPLVGLYMIWYCSVCIQSSAGGGLRAPRLFDRDLNENMWEIFTTYLQVMIGYCISFIPFHVYKAMKGQGDPIYWGLLALGVLIFPMFVLSISIFGFVPALNPIKLVRRVFRVFGQYMLICSALMGVLASLYFIPTGINGYILLGSQFAVFYAFIVFAHLVGRLYYNNRKKLDWF